MFTPAQRDEVRQWIIERAQADPRIMSGALTGSKVRGAEDRWSDIDLAFGVIDDFPLSALLDDWTATFRQTWGVVHQWDLRSGVSVYRVFLLATGLQVDIGVTPQARFGARGSHFHLLFGNPGTPVPVTHPDDATLIGHAWHHVLHGRSCIERAKLWQAEYWIHTLRDQVLMLACLRLGLDPYYARDADRLPQDVLASLHATLVGSLSEDELRRALAMATASLISELETKDATLTPLIPILREFGGLH